MDADELLSNYSLAVAAKMAAEIDAAFLDSFDNEREQARVEAREALRWWDLKHKLADRQRRNNRTWRKYR